MSRVRTVGSIPRGDEFVALLGPRVEQQLPSRGDAGDAEARVLQAVAVPPKKNVGNGSELPDSAPLRLCASATKRFAVRRSPRRGCGVPEEPPLQNRGDAEAQRPVSYNPLPFPQKRTLGMAPNSPTARLCASAPLRQSGSPFAAVGLRRAQGTTTAESQRRRGRRGPCPTSRCRSPKKNVGNGSELPDSAPLRLSAPLRQSRSPFASARVRRARGTATAKSRRRRGAEARVLQAVAVPPKKNVGNGSELPDSAPLRLCASATKRFAVRGGGVAAGAGNNHCRVAETQGTQRPVSYKPLPFPKKERWEWLRTPRQCASAPLCASATKPFAVRLGAGAACPRNRHCKIAETQRRRGPCPTSRCRSPKKERWEWLRTPRQRASAPLRLCDKAVRRSRFAWRGCGGRREQPLQSRRDAGDAEARVLQAVAVPQKRTLGMAPNSPTARLCASATKQFAVRRSPFAALRLRRPSGTATATKPLLFVVLTIEPQSVASPRD